MLQNISHIYFDLFQAWMECLTHHHRRTHPDEPLPGAMSFFEILYCELRYCLGGDTDTESTDLGHVQLNAQTCARPFLRIQAGDGPVYRRHQGEVANFFLDFINCDRTAPSCWRRTDDQLLCNGHPTTIWRVFQLPVALFISLDDYNPTMHTWKFSSHLYPYGDKDQAALEKGIVYQLVGFSVILNSNSASSVHYQSYFSPDDRSVYKYDGLQYQGKAQLQPSESGGLSDDYLRHFVENEAACTPIVLLAYHLVGGLTAQTSFKTRRSQELKDKMGLTIHPEKSGYPIISVVHPHLQTVSLSDIDWISPDKRSQFVKDCKQFNLTGGYIYEASTDDYALDAILRRRSISKSTATGSDAPTLTHSQLHRHIVLSDSDIESEDSNTAEIHARHPPETLCPFCDEPMQLFKNPSSIFRDMLEIAKTDALPDPRQRNSLGLRSSNRELVHSLCQRHRGEDKHLPQAREQGWPDTIDLNRLYERLESIKGYVLDPIVRNPGRSKIFEEMQKKYKANSTNQMQSTRMARSLTELYKLTG
jgi:hypothetical protein